MDNKKLEEVFQKMRVIVVDDVAADRLMVKTMLNKMHIKDVTEANDVKEAIFKIQTAQQFKKPFHLILSNWMMPGITGLQLLERIRAEASSSNVPVIMITGLADRDSVVQSISSGVTDFLIKPVTKDNLEKKITALIEQGKIP